MGAFYSYFYYSAVAEAKKDHKDNKTEEDGEDNEIKKGSDASYTLVYHHAKEEQFHRQAAEEARERELKELRKSNNDRVITDDMWSTMSQEDKKKYLKKQRVRKSRQKKRQAEKVGALASRKKELMPWLEGLTAQQRSLIKEVVWPAPSDPSLLAYLQHHHKEGKLVQCPNRYCSLFFEPVFQNGKAKAPLVLGHDGKPIPEQALANFMDNRFKCFHCDTLFCNKCKAIPYHLGETCDEYTLRTSNPPCKVCKKTLAPLPDEAAKKEITCRSDECLKMVYNMCTATTTCKHPCAGMKYQNCFCLRPSCIEEQSLTQEGGDFCNICWTDELDAGACIKLSCGHIFHRHCVEQRLKHKWTGARISFHYANCPLCQKPIETTPDHNINIYLGSTRDLRNEVKIKAIHFLKVEGLMDDVKNTKHKYYNNPVDYALDIFSFYQCHKCHSPYFGGRRQCGDILNFNPEELVCGGCSGLLSCEKENHGRKYIQYKCRFCCSIAGWFCFGRVHYCENCHNNPYEYWASNNALVGVPPQCKGKASCPLGIDHPPNGFEEMSLGCSRCKLEEAGIVMEETGEDDDMDDDYY